MNPEPIDRQPLRTFSDSSGEVVPYDGTAPIFWRLSVYVLVVRDGNILMKQHPRVDRWELPGGAAETFETLTEGAERECCEETGYRVAVTEASPVHLDEVFFFHRGTNTYHNSVIVVFRGTVAAEPDPTWEPNTREARQICWVDPKSLSPRNTPPFHWAALRKARLV